MIGGVILKSDQVPDCFLLRGSVGKKNMVPRTPFTTFGVVHSKINNLHVYIKKSHVNIIKSHVNID